MDLTGKLTEEQVDQLKRQWAAAQVSGFTLVQESQETDPWDRVIQLLADQTELLQQILDELVTMNEQSDTVSDHEPDMFATLNGPRTSLERCQCGRTDGPSSFVRGDGKLVCIQCCEMESMK